MGFNLYVMSQKPRFDIINKYNITILSLRNKLKNAEGIDELTDIASKIIELEQAIMREKTVGYRRLEDEKKKIKNKIGKLQRELDTAMMELDQLDSKIDHKMNGYKTGLEKKIESLAAEYNGLVKCLNKKS